jgi:hypothetical protein
MSIQNNETCQSKKYSKINDLNKPLNNEEIDELNQFFKCKCLDSFIDSYSRKIYDLFIKNIMFEPNINSANDLYYLGVYYQYIKRYYDLMEKYFLMAIEKGNCNAMNCLGMYYEYEGKNYDLMKKYYLMAIERGNSEAMNDLGSYYGYVEKNYNLMKKYYLQAIDKENSSSMYYLGYYYQYIEENYDLMKKYYLMAINEKNISAKNLLEYYYINNLPNDEDLQNYFNSLIRGSIEFKRAGIIFDNIYIDDNRMINIFCLGIDNINLNVRNFEYCLLKIIDYINCCDLCRSFELCEHCEIKNINHFIRYINKLQYCIKNKQEYKKCANKIFEQYASQIFMEYLDLYYYEYLKKIFAPGGKGYIKTKKHFELITKQTM